MIVTGVRLKTPNLHPRTLDNARKIKPSFGTKLYQKKNIHTRKRDHMAVPGPPTYRSDFFVHLYSYKSITLTQIIVSSACLLLFRRVVYYPSRILIREQNQPDQAIVLRIIQRRYAAQRRKALGVSRQVHTDSPIHPHNV